MPSNIEIPLERKSWVLVTLEAAKDEPLTPVQLQKALFLLEKDHPEISGENYYSFTPYSYGPFDSSIYTDAGILAKEGYLTIKYSGFSNYREYKATEKGIEYAKSIPVNPAIKESINKIVEWVRGLSFQQLIQEIYHKYPDMKVNSVFRD